MKEFNVGEIVKLVGPYGGKTYHVRVLAEDGIFPEVNFSGEIIYNEFDTTKYPGCMVGKYWRDFHYDDFEVLDA